MIAAAALAAALSAPARAAAPDAKAKRLLAAAIALTRKLELSTAAERLDEAMAAAPGWKTAAGFRAACRWTMGDAAGAGQDARLAAGLRPNDALSRAARGKARRVLKDYEGSLADFRALADADPASIEGPLGEGETLAAAGRAREALPRLDEAVRRDPAAADALLVRGSVKERLRDFRGAADDYGSLLELNPRFTWGYLYRGKALRELKDYRGADADLSRFLEANDEHEDAHYLRSNVRFLLGDYRGAVSDLTRVIALDPRKGLAYSNRGQARALLGDKLGALVDLRKALELDPARRDKIQAAIEQLEAKDPEAASITGGASAPAPAPERRVAPRATAPEPGDDHGVFDLESQGEAKPARTPPPDLDETLEPKTVRGRPGPGEKRDVRARPEEKDNGAQPSVFIDQ